MFINNTLIVTIYVPMVSNLAEKAKTSLSKLIISLSYASMLGGTLTLLGTSTNLLVSDVSVDLIGHPFSKFEFTSLGIVVFVFGYIYLVTLGRY